MPAIDASTLSPRAALVQRLASSLGFAFAGVAPAEPSDHADALRDWLDAGRHGEMDYLARYADIAIDPQRALPGAKAIICVADWYGGNHFGFGISDIGSEGQTPATTDAAPSNIASPSEAPNPQSEIPNPKSQPSGRIARYARGDDYHWVMKNRLHEMCDGLRELFPDHLFRAAVDTAPIMEREHAARAGLGWIGKHTLLIHPHFGSWFLLGEILTTLPIETSAEAGFPPPTAAPVDHCGSCTRCIDACPTQCITPHSVDASRCISYLTIEHRSPIDAALHPLVGDWLAGCDVCQEVCPFNAGVERSVRQAEQGGGEPVEATPPLAGLAVMSAYAPRTVSLPLLEVLGWTEEDRRAAVTKSALKRIKLDMFKRNALIALGNALAAEPDATAVARVEAIAGDEREPELVRTTAQQVLSRLRA